MSFAKFLIITILKKNCELLLLKALLRLFSENGKIDDGICNGI